MQPLIGRPPDKPPPVLLLRDPPTPDPQGEHIEMTEYTAPQVKPQPYEVVKSYRYAEEPRPSTSSPHSAIEHTTFMQATPDIEPQYTEPFGTPEEDQNYYSRPMFYKKDRGFSTSTHIYGECSRNSSSSSTYISPNQLEPFFSQKTQHAELMLAAIEESAGHTTSDFLHSDSSEDGNYGNEARDKKTSLPHLTRHSSDEAESWLGKSPATGQIGDRTEHGYENTRRNVLQHIEEGQEMEYQPKYQNTPVKPRNIAQISTKDVPNVPSKKKVTQQRSAPVNRQRGGNTVKGLRGDDTYTGLVHETSNYTSVYTSTLPSRSREKQY